jgi:hypothetical protein
VSVGRRPNSQGLGLENTQVEINERGFVQCDKQQRTRDPHLLAIGDVAGEPMLAHKATHEAKVAVEVVLGKAAEFDKVAVPAVVFTDPEIAWAGLTEDQAKRSGRSYETSVYPWAASGRAQALGRTEGLTKWLIDPDTQRVLGCGMVGPGAGELIAEAVLAIEMGCEVRDLTETIHPHPTLSETLMNAGEVFFGTATEIYKPRRSSKYPCPSQQLWPTTDGQRCPSYKYHQVDAPTNRSTSASTLVSHRGKASSAVAQSMSSTCQYSMRSDQSGNCSTIIRRCSNSFKATARWAACKSTSVNCTGYRASPFKRMPNPVKRSTVKSEIGP